MRSFQHLLVGLESNLAPSDWQGGLDVRISLDLVQLMLSST
jgi:hypothetical protein